MLKKEKRKEKKEKEKEKRKRKGKIRQENALTENRTENS